MSAAAISSRTKHPIRVRIIHQTDPAGAITGGIDTVILGLAKNQPDDVEISIIGLTMDPVERPVGTWSKVSMGQRIVEFFPVGVHNTPMHRSKIPLSLRLTLGIIKYKKIISQDAELFEFHRLEPSLPFYFDKRPKNAFVHQNMNALYNKNSDIGWRHFPQLFFAMEALILPKFQSVFAVREDAIQIYQKRYPGMAGIFRFLPTWMDPDVFKPVSLENKAELRRQLELTYSLSPQAQILVSVGRLDQQKNPLLAVEAMGMVCASRPNTVLIMVGDGPLRSDILAKIKESRLEGKIVLAGLKKPIQIAEILQAADLYLMTSSYEGMPISLLEAMGCGLPIVSTTVGEVPRVLETGRNGTLVGQNTASELAHAIIHLLSSGRLGDMGKASLNAVRPYTPGNVLSAVWAAYRKPWLT